MGLYRLRGATRILRSLSADNWTSAAGQSADQSIPGVTSDSRRALIAGMRASFRRCEHWPIDAVLDELALPEDEPRQPPGEFDGSGSVAGRVVYLKCPEVETAPYVRRRIPKRVWDNPTGTAVKGRHDDEHGWPNGEGIDRDGLFGEAPVPTGRWVWGVPFLETPNCAPRPAFQIDAKMFYEIIFRFGRSGQCSAIVRAGPVGNSHPQRVVARVGSS